MDDTKQIVTTRNIMLATVLTFVLLSVLLTIGMLTPLIARLTSSVEMSMDSQYFNNRSALPAALLVVLLTMCLFIGYLRSRNTLIIAGAAIVVSILFAIISPFKNTPIDVTVPVIAIALVAVLYKMVRMVDKQSTFKTMRGIGAHIIHLGILLILLGVVVSTNVKVEDSTVLSLDEMGTFENHKYSIKITEMTSGYEGIPFQQNPGSSYVTNIDFDVYKNNNYFDSCRVKYITDFKWGQTYTTTYIHRGFLEEVFVAPRAIDEAGSRANLFVRVVPFIRFVWSGIYIMAIGIVIIGITEYIKAGRRFKLETSGSGKTVQKEEKEALETDEYEDRLERELTKRKTRQSKD